MCSKNIYNCCCRLLLVSTCHFTSLSLGEKPAEKFPENASEKIEAFKNPAVFLLCNGFRRRDIINISEGTSHHLTGSREHLLCTLTALCTCAVAAQSENFPFHRSGKKEKKKRWNKGGKRGKDKLATALLSTKDAPGLRPADLGLCVTLSGTSTSPGLLSSEGPASCSCTGELASHHSGGCLGNSAGLWSQF